MTLFGNYLTTDPITGGGTTILNGTGPPADALGAVGNYYLDTVAKILYGPKGSYYGADQVAVAVNATGTTSAGVSTLGLKIRPLVAGRITSLKFWRVNSGTAYSVTLLLFLQSSQAELGRVTVSVPSGSASGWALGTLSSPVAVSASTDYRIGLCGSTGTAIPLGFQASFVPTTAIPGVMTLIGNCVGPSLSYPLNDNTDYFFMDVVFQAAASSWPLALKSAP
jgi:hypothetical protein